METEIDLRDILRIIRKYIWTIIAIVFLATAAVGAVSLFVMQPIYEASTKLIVSKSDEAIGLSQLDLNTVNLNIRLIDTYKEVIKTPAIMDIVAERHPDLGLSSEQLIDKVKVSSVNNTQVMTLTVEDPSYDRAVRIVNAVSRVFIDEIPKLLRVDNVSLLSEAKTGTRPEPIKPRTALNAAVGFVLSLMIALGVVFLREYLDDSIRSEADVARVLGLPTLAAIPKARPQDLAKTQAKAEAAAPGKKAGEAYHASVNQNY